MKKNIVFLITLLALAFAFSSFFIINSPANLHSGVFSCIINDKPYILNNIKAELRTVTGGHKQLSISNDLFTSFFFINPSAKEIVLSPSQKREAIVRYTNPSNLNLYLPETGLVRINISDEKAKILNGEFEMNLVPKEQAGKKIKITNGRLINIPIIEK